MIDDRAGGRARTLAQPVAPTSRAHHAALGRLAGRVTKAWTPLVLFLATYAVFVAATFADYGVTWDEGPEYHSGKALLDYLTRPSNVEAYFAQVKKYGGSPLYYHLYPMVLVFLNHDRIDYITFHLFSLIFAGLIFVAAYAVLLRQYRRGLYAALGPIFLVLTPQFLGHSPADSKDISFAVSYFLSLSAVFLLGRNNNILVKIVVLGFLFGITQSLRIVGFTLYPILLIFDLWCYLRARETRFGKYVADRLLAYVLILLVANYLMVIAWPFLGSAYPRNLLRVIQAAKSYSDRGTILFMGRAVGSTSYPWYYLPVWIGVTTPLFVLGLFFLAPFAKDRLSNDLLVLFSFAFLVNAVMYFVLKPVIYDGPRHFLFLIVIMSLIAAISAIELWMHRRQRFLAPAMAALLVLNALLVTKDLADLHPYEYIYFNELVGGLPGASGKFETDYWGAGYKEAVEWLKQNEIKPETTYYIKTCGEPTSSTYFFSSNMKWTNDLKQADYYVCFTRWNQDKLTNQGQIIHVVERESVPLIYIRRLKQPS